MNDTLATEAVNTALTIAETIKGGNLITGVPNSALTFIITTLAGIVLRIIEKKRLRKKGHLNDKPTQNL
jgi:hypothetical protein